MESEEPEERREKLREVKLAEIVPVPVAAGFAYYSSHSMVSPSVLCPSWNTHRHPDASPAPVHLRVLVFRQGPLRAGARQCGEEHGHGCV